jgi:hypothetical protein
VKLLYPKRDGNRRRRRRSEPQQEIAWENEIKSKIQILEDVLALQDSTSLKL